VWRVVSLGTHDWALWDNFLDQHIGLMSGSVMNETEGARVFCEPLDHALGEARANELRAAWRARVLWGGADVSPRFCLPLSRSLSPSCIVPMFHSRADGGAR